MIRISQKLLDIAAAAEESVKDVFRRIDEVSLFNTQKVLAAFQKHRVDESCFQGSTGYGYSDKGRACLGAIFADIFGCEDAVAGTAFVSGTHAITCGLFGALRPGDKLISAAGPPYDTLLTVIGKSGAPGSLMQYGVDYEEVPLDSGLRPDPEGPRGGAQKRIGAFDPAVRGIPSKRAFRRRDRGTHKDREDSNPGLKIIVDNFCGNSSRDANPASGCRSCDGVALKNPGAPSLRWEDILPETAYRRGLLPVDRSGAGQECGASLNSLRSLSGSLSRPMSRRRSGPPCLRRRYGISRLQDAAALRR